jgi:hypothetical protein
VNKTVKILIAAYVIGGFVCVGFISVLPPPAVSPYVPPVLPMITGSQPVDIHEMNAQIFVNTSYTDGYAGYLTAQHPSGEIANYLIITARSPGNSTLTLSTNGTYIFQDLVFSNITTQNFIVATSSNMSFVIAIHSEGLNYTRVMTYYGNVVTPVTFVNYESNLVKKVQSGPSITNSIAALTYIPAAAVGVFAAFEVALFTREWRKSHPDLGKNQVGGMGRDIK